MPASILIGLGAVMALPQPGAAGERITFSSPSQDSDLPARKEAPANLPKPSLKWDLRGPDPEVMPPLQMPVDPALQKKLRERQEQQRNWLLKEPALFRDRFPDPFTKTNKTSEESLSPWDQAANRLFGQPEEKEQEKAPQPRPLSPVLEDDSGRTGPGGEQPGARSLVSRESSERDRDRDRRPNSPETAVKALFGPKEPAGDLGSGPGLSLSDTIERADAITRKHDPQFKREEFQRLLAPPAGGPLDPISSLQDLTRAPAYPVAPVFTPSLPAARTPFGSPAALIPEDRLPRMGSVLDTMPINQPAPVAQPPPDSRRQLESLNLMSRPSVLSLPGSKF
jgi:hypothetical protein